MTKIDTDGDNQENHDSDRAYGDVDTVTTIMIRMVIQIMMRSSVQRSEFRAGIHES